MSSFLFARKIVRYSLWRVVFLSADRAASASTLSEYVFALGSACFGRDSACVVKSSMRRSLSAEDGGLEISKEDVESSPSSIQLSVLCQDSHDQVRTCYETVLSVLKPYEQLGPRCVCLLSEQLLLSPSVCVDVLDRVRVCILDRMEARQTESLGEDQSSSFRVDGR